MLAYVLTTMTLIKCKENRKWYIWPNLCFSGKVFPQGQGFPTCFRGSSTSSNVSVICNECDDEGKSCTQRLWPRAGLFGRR